MIEHPFMTTMAIIMDILTVMDTTLKMYFIDTIDITLTEIDLEVEGFLTINTICLQMHSIMGFALLDRIQEDLQEPINYKKLAIIFL